MNTMMRSMRVMEDIHTYVDRYVEFLYDIDGGRIGDPEVIIPGILRDLMMEPNNDINEDLTTYATGTRYAFLQTRRLAIQSLFGVTPEDIVGELLNDLDRIYDDLYEGRTAGRGDEQDVFDGMLRDRGEEVRYVAACRGEPFVSDREVTAFVMACRHTFACDRPAVWAECIALTRNICCRRSRRWHPYPSVSMPRPCPRHRAPPSR